MNYLLKLLQPRCNNYLRSETGLYKLSLEYVILVNMELMQFGKVPKRFS